MGTATGRQAWMSIQPLVSGRVAVCLLLLSLALSIPAAHAEAPYGSADLAGTWSIHLLSGAGANTSSGSTLRGTVTFDSNGAVLVGSFQHSDGGVTTLSGGELSVASDGVASGLLLSTDPGDGVAGVIPEARRS